MRIPQFRILVIAAILISFFANGAVAKSRRPRRSAGDRGICTTITQTNTQTTQAFNKEALVALVTAKGEMSTAASQPTFWFYVPFQDPSLLTAEFILRDDQEQRSIEPLRLQLPNQPGIVSVRSPQPLKVNQSYHWYFSVICDVSGEQKKLTVDGWVRYVEPSTTVITQLKQATTIEQAAALYVKSGFWSDALTLLASHRKQNERSAIVWADLLQSEQLEAVTSKPVLPCCTDR
ncbi:DUF928 domain-containing protein [Phormidesmis sp. 146-33]